MACLFTETDVKQILPCVVLVIKISVFLEIRSCSQKLPGTKGLLLVTKYQENACNYNNFQELPGKLLLNNGQVQVRGQWELRSDWSLKCPVLSLLISAFYWSDPRCCIDVMWELQVTDVKIPCLQLQRTLFVNGETGNYLWDLNAARDCTGSREEQLRSTQSFMVIYLSAV